MALLHLRVHPRLLQLLHTDLCQHLRQFFSTGARLKSLGEQVLLDMSYKIHTFVTINWLTMYVHYWIDTKGNLCKLCAHPFSKHECVLHMQKKCMHIDKLKISLESLHQGKFMSYFIISKGTFKIIWEFGVYTLNQSSIIYWEIVCWILSGLSLTDATLFH